MEESSNDEETDKEYSLDFTAITAHMNEFGESTSTGVVKRLNFTSRLTSIDKVAHWLQPNE